MLLPQYPETSVFKNANDAEKAEIVKCAQAITSANAKAREGLDCDAIQYSISAEIINGALGRLHECIISF